MSGEIQNLTDIMKPDASRFNIHKLYVLPTQCIYVFYMDVRTKQRLFPYKLLANYFV